MCNSYLEPSNLFINKETTLSQDCTTQGDSLAMSMCGIAIITFTELLYDCFTFHEWYAEDGNALSSLDNLKELFDLLK